MIGNTLTDKTFSLNDLLYVMNDFADITVKYGYMVIYQGTVREIWKIADYLNYYVNDLYLSRYGDLTVVIDMIPKCYKKKSC